MVMVSESCSYKEDERQSSPSCGIWYRRNSVQIPLYGSRHNSKLGSEKGTEPEVQSKKRAFEDVERGEEAISNFKRVRMICDGKSDHRQINTVTDQDADSSTSVSTPSSVSAAGATDGIRPSFPLNITKGHPYMTSA